MTTRQRGTAVPAAVRDLLVQRYSGNAASTGIALSAALEAIQDERALDDLARAWHATRIAQSEAAAALSGAVAALVADHPETELTRRTGLPIETIRTLSSQQPPRQQRQ